MLTPNPIMWFAFALRPYCELITQRAQASRDAVCDSQNAWMLQRDKG